MRWASYRRIDDLDKNSFYFVLHFETSSVIAHRKAVTKVTTLNSLKGGGGTMQQNLFKVGGGGGARATPIPPPMHSLFIFKVHICPSM